MAVDTGASALEPASDLLIACALKKEAAALSRLLPGLSIVPTGLGAKRTGETLEQLLSRKPAARLLLFTGAAGGLDPSIRMGDIVCPVRWLTEDGLCFAAAPSLVADLRAGGWDVAGDGLTGVRPVLRATSRRLLFQKTGARICDMEAAAALRAAERHGIPALAAKVVSDTGESSIFAFWTRFDQNMRRLADYLAKLCPTLQRLSALGGQ